MSDGGKILETSDLSKSFGAFRALDGLSLELSRGQIQAIIGPNGAGKSTFLNVVSGLLQPTRGETMFDGRNVTAMPAHARARLGMARSFQITSIFTGLTVGANVQLALMAQRGDCLNPLQVTGRRYENEVRDLLESVGIGDMAERPSGQLAAGDRKRVEFAVALAGSPKVLLLDEPTAGMSNAERQIVIDIMINLARNRNIGILFTEHDIDMVFENADRITVMHQGQMLAQGTPGEVRVNPRVREVYLGEDEDA